MDHAMITSEIDLAGFYVVAGKKYYNKLEAYRAALPQGWWPHWNFNEDYFSQLDWTQEPQESLWECYAMRARDLRSRYDHVQLNFTGGSDSDNIARVFFDHNIVLDSLVHWDYSGYTNRRDYAQDTANLANETTLAVKPRIQEYQSRYDLSRTEVRLDDMMAKNYEFWQHQSRDPYTTNYYLPVMPAKERAHELTPTALRHRKVVKISGLDKPCVVRRDGRFYFRFTDTVVHNNMLYTKLGDNDLEKDECFYWHPHAAKLLVKQGHEVKKWFKARPHLLWILDSLDHDPDANELYQEMVKTIVYPYWSSDCWQWAKPKTNVDHKGFYWFYQDRSTLAFRNWYDMAIGYSQEVQSIYARSPVVSNFKKNGHFAELPGNYSKFYDLGT
jgi:hypothetical protein